LTCDKSAAPRAA